jgi:glutamine amidotransferase
MCRLFGFRSVLQSQVHRSLVSAENALAVQSQKHPDGWGVAYYLAECPHVIKSVGAAIDDHIFQRVSGVVTSETVLAHVRRATVGEHNILNTHPFQYGKWIFAHNGNVPQFESVRPRLLEDIAPKLRRFILGDTDSEVLFYHFLSNLQQHADLHRKGTLVELIVDALRATLHRTRELADRGEGDDERSLLTVIATDGLSMVGICWGRSLHFSTYKTKCLDRDHCPFYADECEAETRSGFVNHLVLSSEPLLGQNIWTEMSDGDIVGVDWRMRLYRGELCASMKNVEIAPVARA